MPPAFAEASLFRKPVPTPDQVRGRLFRDHALASMEPQFCMAVRDPWNRSAAKVFPAGGGSDVRRIPKESDGRHSPRGHGGRVQHARGREPGPTGNLWPARTTSETRIISGL